MTAFGLTSKTVYRCAMCNRQLKKRWVYSKSRGVRYCWPGDGCNRQRKER